MAKTIMVLFGGVSTEYLVSLRSAYNIIGGLRQSRDKIIRVGITPQGEWLRFDGSDDAIRDDQWQDIAREQADASRVFPNSPADWITGLCGCRPDVIFLAVHGINCEDGTLQGLLELTGIPYVGSGVLASAGGMDKLHAKLVFQKARIPQCRYTSARRESIEQDPVAVAKTIAADVGFPCFLKPNNGGSSVGTMRATSLEELAKALVEVSRYDRLVVVEEFIWARELEVAVLGNDKPRASVVSEIVTSDDVEYYDYEAKYFMSDGAEVMVPANLDEALARRIRRLAVKAYKALGCSGLSRVDFFLDKESGRLMLNEINTLPGFTPISVFPKAFEASGVPIEKLVKKLCQLAIDRHQINKRLEVI